MKLGLFDSVGQHKIKGNQYFTMMFITDPTKGTKSIKIPKWIRFPMLILAVAIIWKSLLFYEYVVSLEAQVANTSLNAQESQIDSETKDVTIFDLQYELDLTKETRYEQLVALKELAVKLGLRLEELESYRDAMEEFKQEIDNNIGTDSGAVMSDEDLAMASTEDTSTDMDLSEATKILQKSPVDTLPALSTSSNTFEELQVILAANQGGAVNEMVPSYDTIDFEAEIFKIYDYLDYVMEKVDSSEKVFEETSGSLEDIIPVLESYPGVLPIKNTYITSYFGYRRNPFGGRSSEFHTGVDLKASYQDVSATAAGVVVESKYLAGYGYTVIIDHGNGLMTKYAHNSKLYVEIGDEVLRGDIIAKSGNSGRSTGPHLHYEILLNGEPQDPLDYIYKEND